MAGEKVLLVDDEYEVVEALGRFLRAAGYQVSIARNGEEAVQAALDDTPQIIISDVMMPEVNGFQMCRKLKEHESTADIPVLLMSGKVDPADRYWAEETGALDLLNKPIEPKKLVARVASIIAA